MARPCILLILREAQAHGIATIYQEFSLYPELTVAENIFSGNMPRTFGGFALDWSRAAREAAKLYLNPSMPLISMCGPRRHAFGRKPSKGGNSKSAFAKGPDSYFG